MPWYERAQSRAGQELFKEMSWDFSFSHFHHLSLFKTRNTRKSLQIVCSIIPDEIICLQDFILLQEICCFNNTDTSFQQSHLSNLQARKCTKSSFRW